MGLVTASPVGVAAGWFSVEESKMSLYLSILFSLSPSLCLLLSVSLSLCVCFPAPHGGIQHHPRNRASNATSLTDKNAVILTFSPAPLALLTPERAVFSDQTPSPTPPLLLQPFQRGWQPATPVKCARFLLLMVTSWRFVFFESASS